MLPGFSLRGHKVLKKLFEEFQDSYSAWPSLISEWNDLSNSVSLFALMPPIKFLLKRMYGLEEDII